MNHRASVLVLALAALGGLAGCASPRADAALEAQNNLVGMSKATLLSCAGAPAAAMAASPSEEVLTYESRAVRGYRSGPSFGVGFGGGSGNFGYGMGFPIFGGSDYVDDSENCRATFTLRNGFVTKVVYGGTDPRTGRRLEQCYQIVENCLQRPAGNP